MHPRPQMKFSKDSHPAVYMCNLVFENRPVRLFPIFKIKVQFQMKRTKWVIFIFSLVL